MNNANSAADASINGAATKGAAGTMMMPLLHHPILSKTVVLPTIPIAELITTLRRAIVLREQGCCFSATSGYGKSFALTIAEATLKDFFPGVPIFRHIINNHQVPSIRAFFKHFLTTVGVVNLQGETYNLRVRLINKLVEYGRASALNLVVILVDEAQGMLEQDFRFLKDVGNELEKVEVQLLVVMMGQDPEFSLAIKALRNTNRLDLISRFTLRHATFRGLQTERDFRQLLSIIDERRLDSDERTWTESFAPKLWASGWRMGDQARHLMDAVSAKVPGGLAERGVAARQLFLAIRRFLLDVSEIDAEGGTPPPELWRAAVAYALIEEAATVGCKEDLPPRRTRRAKV